MNDIVIRAENVTKTYRRGKIPTEALRGIDLSILRGTFCCIVGPSGHGKSTLMHLMGGLDRPTSGTITLDGEELTRLSKSALAGLRARKVGFVFQFFNLLPTLTAEENVAAAALFAGRTPAPGEARNLLARVGLADKARARPNELSGGQQQRVAIARALANDPEILLMDEPTGNLDSAAEAEVLAAVDELHRRGKTIIVVTHNPDIAARAQRVVRVKDGRIEI